MSARLLHNLTLKHENLSLSLKTPCRVSIGFDPASDPSQPYSEFQAIWDTGATNSVVTAAVVAGCGLIATGMVQTHGVHGVQDCRTYLANFLLPNGVQFKNVRVTEGKLTTDVDVLIGMDIITTGDFAISNRDGRTWMTFRVPSIGRWDFVEEGKASNAAARKAAAQPRGPTLPRRKRQSKQFGKQKRK